MLEYFVPVVGALVIALVVLGVIVAGLSRVLEFSDPSPSEPRQVKSRLVGPDGEDLYLVETPPSFCKPNRGRE